MKMYNTYELEKAVENQKAELDCVSRQGWKWKNVKKQLGKLSVRQLFAAEPAKKVFCRECLDY
ncbi:MAG TPA: hypothetical protein VF149_03875 [Bacillales bacterium]